VGGQHNSFCGLHESTDVVKMVNVMMNADKLTRSAQSGCLTVHFQPLSYTDCMLPVVSGYIGTSNGCGVIYSTMYFKRLLKLDEAALLRIIGHWLLDTYIGEPIWSLNEHENPHIDNYSYLYELWELWGKVAPI